MKRLEMLVAEEGEQELQMRMGRRLAGAAAARLLCLGLFTQEVLATGKRSRP